MKHQEKAEKQIRRVILFCNETASLSQNWNYYKYLHIYSPSSNSPQFQDIF
jgi:hypothetical protein